MRRYVKILKQINKQTHKMELEKKIILKDKKLQQLVISVCRKKNMLDYKIY